MDLTHANCVEIAEKNRLQMQHGKNSSKARAATLWKQTNRSWWKVNVDTTMKTGSGIGIRVVIRNENGEILGSCFQFLRTAFSVDVAECLAVRENVQYSESIHANRIVIETDCQSLFNRLQTSNKDISYFSSLIFDILCPLSLVGYERLTLWLIVLLVLLWRNRLMILYLVVLPDQILFPSSEEKSLS